ncbi:MAG: S8 family serine peptidase [Bacteroidia bacterium]|nr:S8 family serine peptidase [Bacteroidia bacterium]
MKKLYPILALCVFLPLTVAVAQGSRYEVLLKSGKTIFPENLSGFLQNPSIRPEEAVQNQFFRLVQFYQVPDQVDKEQFLATGARIIDYLPRNTFVVVFPLGYNTDQLQNFAIRSVMPILPRYKINPVLENTSLPDYAFRGDRVELVVQYYPTLSRQTVVRGLLKAGIPITEEPAKANLINILVLPEDIYKIAALPFLSYIELISPPPVAEDTRGKSAHRANVLNAEFSAGRHYDGFGVNILCRDDGIVGPHIDFQGRIDNSLTNNPNGTHGDGVSGIMTGAGNLNPSIQGMAPGAFLYVTDYEANFLDTTLGLHIYHDVMVTNSSYSNGCNAGYTTITRTVDEQSFDYPTLLHVFSAGNSNNLDCGYGAGNQWGNITGGHKQGKNVIATANLLSNDVLVNSSSRGPAHDGRIKPDISANGNGQQSTSPDNGYITFSGTSAAAPGIAGVAAQLYQAYKNLHGGQNPEGSLVKAAMLNTADDVGNTGPDFQFGWGRINARRAVEIFEKNTFFSSTLTQNGNNLHTISVPANTRELRIMVYWMDPPAAVQAGIALVNDLNMQVTAPDNGIHNPWILDPTPNPANLNALATTGIDNLNNVEQVHLLNPLPGSYNINVNGFSVPQGPQKYYVVYTFVPEEIVVTYPYGGEGIAPGEAVRIRWDAPGFTPADGTFTLEYTLNNGASWNLISSNVPANVRLFDWGVPANISGNARIRVSRGVVSDESEADFSIIGVPDIQLTASCPSNMTISWAAIPGASAYDIFLLGAKYMDSLTTISATPNPSYTLFVPIQETHWIAVRARGANGERGRRSLAIVRESGIRQQCPISNDVGLVAGNSGVEGPFQDCRTYSIPVKALLKNEGNNGISNIPVFYQLGNNSPVSATYSGIIAPGGTVLFTFPTLLNLSQTGILPLTIWAEYTADSINYNDTTVQLLNVQPSLLATVPMQEDFESFSNCTTTPNCGQEVCGLMNGWINGGNGMDDDIDWRVNSGSTPTLNTGPDFDHKPGTGSGKYLYLEASGGCNQQEAILLSPCIDLTNVSAGEFSFWYHMFGNTIGELHVDISFGNVWLNDYISPISGNQGNVWKNAKINLAPFSGLTVNIRIRGTTGNGPQSDIAIDDIAVYDLAGPPLTDFDASVKYTCPGQTVQFTDQSLNTPLSWEWTFSPNAVTYIAATTQNSQHPLVQFLAEGVYEVSLTTTNANGNAARIKTGFITITGGEVPDLLQTFEGNDFPPQNWRREDQGGGITWDTATVTGSDGNPSRVVYALNFNNPNIGDQDNLISWKTDLSVADKPLLVFDVAYAQFDAGSSDQLQVWVAQNCSENFSVPIYIKSGAVLATAPPSEDPFIPAQASDWRRDTVDLSPYKGSVITLMFKNINDFGNIVALDNIQVIETGNAGPNADFSLTPEEVCEGATLIFTDQTTGGQNIAYSWNFGADATPSSATTAGPHSVVFNSPGTKIVSLSVGDASGATISSQAFVVSPLPAPDFSYTTVGAVYKFANATVNGNTYFWDFGDGGTSTLADPQHLYTTNNSYQVMLVAGNDCGLDTTFQTIDVTTVGLEDDFGRMEVTVYPNPGSDLFNLALSGDSKGTFICTIVDMTGREVKNFELEKYGEEAIQPFSLKEHTAGIYFLRIVNNRNGPMRLLKLVKE